MSKLVEGIDFYYNEEGLMVLTKNYLVKRGYCCQSGCQHCPYDYASKVDPSVPSELQDPWGTIDSDSDSGSYDPDDDLD